MEQGKIRVFIGIELSNEVRRKVQEIQSELKPLIRAKVSWAKPENIHITLKFLGEVNVNKIDSIKEELKKVSKMYSLFEMSFRGIGAFPNFRRPRVIWVGVDLGFEFLTQIAKAIEKAMKKFGFPSEGRNFTPHLTLGRIKAYTDSEEINPKFWKFDKPDIPIMQIDRFGKYIKKW